VAVARAMERRLDDCSIMNLANSIWAFATMRQQNELLLGVIKREVEQRCSYVYA